jgi:hypothetical protein
VCQVRNRKVAYVANFVSGVTIDCLDPQRVARFWSALLGREQGPSQDGWVYLGHRGDSSRDWSSSRFPRASRQFQNGRPQPGPE